MKKLVEDMVFLKHWITTGMVFTLLFSTEVLASEQLDSKPALKFRCHRSFTYRGQTLPCDSTLNTDAEALKSILKNSTEAMDYFNAYQSNQKRVTTLAYMGTIGILIFASNVIFSNSANRTESKKKVDSLIKYSGLGITLGSTLFGISFLRNNEQNLFSAVEAYNKEFLKDQIQLNFNYQF